MSSIPKTAGMAAVFSAENRRDGCGFLTGASLICTFCIMRDVKHIYPYVSQPVFHVKHGGGGR